MGKLQWKCFFELHIYSANKNFNRSTKKENSNDQYFLMTLMFFKMEKNLHFYISHSGK